MSIVSSFPGCPSKPSRRLARPPFAILTSLALMAPHAAAITDAEEIDLGQRTSKDIESRMGPVLPAASLESRRVAAIGRRFVPLTTRQNLPFTFRVLSDGNTLNAFSLPGGPVYVTRRMLSFVKNDDELAAVLGHEVGHIQLKHGRKRIEAEQGTQNTAQRLAGRILDKTTVDRTAPALKLATSIAFNLCTRGYDRNQEMEADQVGVRWMSRLGYDPYASVRLFQRMDNLQKEDGGQQNGEVRAVEAFLSTHPSPHDRAVRLQNQIRDENLSPSHPVRIPSPGWDNPGLPQPAPVPSRVAVTSRAVATQAPSPAPAEPGPGPVPVPEETRNRLAAPRPTPHLRVHEEPHRRPTPRLVPQAPIRPTIVPPKPTAIPVRPAAPPAVPVSTAGSPNLVPIPPKPEFEPTETNSRPFPFGWIVGLLGLASCAVAAVVWWQQRSKTPAPAPPGVMPVPRPVRGNTSLLVIHSPNGGCQTVQVSDDEIYTVGRADDADVHLPDAEVSGRHAQLRFVHGQWWIEDLQSTNGLLVDGQKQRRVALPPGQRVQLGKTILRIERGLD